MKTLKSGHTYILNKKGKTMKRYVDSISPVSRDIEVTDELYTHYEEVKRGNTDINQK